MITKLLGQGGMAAVYEIWNAQLEMFRAVKIINPGSADIVHQRFQTEIKISAKLKHPNIIEIYSVGEWNKLPYIEMEKIDGVGLDEIISKRGALPAIMCTSIGIQICRALKYAHNQECTIYGKNYHGVIHRDLKPANIMVARNGTVKLMDFGIARPAEVSFHTMDGLVAGTLQYLAPEQIERNTLDVRTDLYAVGIIMYEIVTGTIAFPQTSFAQLVTCKTKSKFTPIESFSLSIPKRLKSLIYKCMQYERQNRVADAAHLLKELESIHRTLTNKGSEEIIARMMADDGEKKNILIARRRFPWKAACAACLAAAAVAGVFYFAVAAYRLNRASRVLSVAPPIAEPHPTSPAPAVVPDTTLAKETAKLPDTIGERQFGKKSPVMVHAAIASAKFHAALPVPSKQQTVEIAPRRMSLAESMKNTYGTADLLDIIGKELTKKNWSNVLALFEVLPQEQARSDQALVYKMRALDGAGNGTMLAAFLQKTSINDGEFYLAKAKMSLKTGEYGECRKLLDKSLNSPHKFIEYSILKREVLYHLALCVTSQFDGNPSEEAYKNALDAWWQLRSFLHSDPGHEYNKKANDELQRIGKKMQKG